MANKISEIDRRFFLAGVVFGLLGVIIGAFATHGLAPKLEASAITSFETGVRYQIYHALLLLILSVLPIPKSRSKSVVFYLLIFGIILFSGSIYLLATNTLSSVDFSKIALTTPIGGSLLIFAWIILGKIGIMLKTK